MLMGPGLALTHPMNDLEPPNPCPATPPVCPGTRGAATDIERHAASRLRRYWRRVKTRRLKVDLKHELKHAPQGRK